MMSQQITGDRPGFCRVRSSCTPARLRSGTWRWRSRRRCWP